MTEPNFERPLVSICIPAYNGAAFIEETLQSALRQTYAPLEIIITDDCSADDTVAIARKYAAANSHVFVHVNSTNKGLTGNWQECIDKSNGQWIKLLFQDDIIAPDCVEKMVTACIKNNGKVAICARKFMIGENTAPAVKNFFQHKVIKPEQLFISRVYYTPAEIAQVLAPHLLQNVLGEPSAWLLHKDVLAQAPPFNARMRQLMDYEFFMLCIMQFGMVFIKEELLRFRVHDDSETSRNVNDTSGTADARVIGRNIQSHTGDYMEIISMLVNNECMQPLTRLWGKKKLQLLFDKLYFKSVRKYGEAQTIKALQPTLDKAVFKVKPYSFFNYIINKLQYIIWVKPLLKSRITL